MMNLELVLNMLAETATTEISKKRKPKSFIQNRKVAKAGSKIAGDARKNLEKETGKKVINSSNYLSGNTKIRLK